MTSKIMFIKDGGVGLKVEALQPYPFEQCADEEMRELD